MSMSMDDAMRMARELHEQVMRQRLGQVKEVLTQAGHTPQDAACARCVAQSGAPKVCKDGGVAHDVAPGVVLCDSCGLRFAAGGPTPHETGDVGQEGASPASVVLLSPPEETKPKDYRLLRAGAFQASWSLYLDPTNWNVGVTWLRPPYPTPQPTVVVVFTVWLLVLSMKIVQGDEETA